MEFEPIQQERAVPSDSNLHANLHDPDSLTYEPSLGLREKAFSLSPDPRFFFRHSSHGQAFDALVAGIRRGEGILVMTGEVGTGKSTLCRAVLKSLDPTTAAAFLPDPSLSREDLFKNLVTDFGIVAAEDIRTGRLRGASRFDLGSMLTEFVRSRQRAQAFAVVVIDEAQKLPAPILEEIRILCDLEDGEQVLRFILVGQPDLQSRLDTPEMRHITQRLTVRFELAPLAHAEVSEYISHRLTVAGNPDLEFTSPAIDLVWAVSRGIPRVINLVCDRALFRAAHAATRTIDFDQILAAVDDLNLHVDREVRVRSSDEHAWGLESFTPEARESQSAPHQWTSPSQPEPLAQPQSERAAPSSGIAEPSGAETGGAASAPERIQFTSGSSDREWLDATAAAVRTPPLSASRGEAAAPAADQVEDTPEGQVTAPGPDLESLDRDWMQTLEARGQESAPAPGTRDGWQSADPVVFPAAQFPGLNEPPAPRLEQAGSAPRQRQLWPGAVVVAFIAITALVGYRFGRAEPPPPPSSEVQAAREVPTDAAASRGVPTSGSSTGPEGAASSAQASLPMRPSVPGDVSPNPLGGASGRSERVSPAPAPAVRRQPASQSSQTNAATFAIRIGIFQNAENAARIVQELRGGGYPVYTTDTSLPSGKRAVAVFLGPYGEQARAEQDSTARAADARVWWESCDSGAAARRRALIFRHRCARGTSLRPWRARAES